MFLYGNKRKIWKRKEKRAVTMGQTRYQAGKLAKICKRNDKFLNMKVYIFIFALCLLSIATEAQETPTRVMTDCNFDYDYRLRYYLSPYDIHTTEDLIQQAKDINTNDSQYPLE